MDLAPPPLEEVRLLLMLLPNTRNTSIPINHVYIFKGGWGEQISEEGKGAPDKQLIRYIQIKIFRYCIPFMKHNWFTTLYILAVYDRFEGYLLSWVFGGVSITRY